MFVAGLEAAGRGEESCGVEEIREAGSVLLVLLEASELPGAELQRMSDDGVVQPAGDGSTEGAGCEEGDVGAEGWNVIPAQAGALEKRGLLNISRKYFPAALAMVHLMLSTRWSIC